MTTTTETPEVTERDRRVAAAECYVRSRFYPPLPYQYGEYGVQAVDACNDNDEEREILLDPSLPIHPRAAVHHESGSVSIPAAGLVDALHLWHMVEEPCPDCGGTGIAEEIVNYGPADGCAVETWDCETCAGRGMC